MSRLDAGVRWLLVILVPLVVVKAIYSAAWHHPAGYDGGLYTDFAQHILAGEGITTNVSLYHRAFTSFPHHDSIQPLWPLVYAAGAAVSSIAVASVWLPTIFWVLSLLFAFAWARRVLPTPFSPRVPGFGAGHVLVLVLALHGLYFIHTSRPYTEGFAYALLFVFLWRSPKLFAALDVKAGAEVGLWIGLLLLVRSQFFIVLAAFGLAGVVALVVDKAARRDLAVFGAVAVAAFCLTMAPYLVYLGVHTEGFTPMNYVLFNETPADSPLSHPAPYVRPHGMKYVEHVYKGLKLAWGFKRSYFPSFHLAHWALPVALGVVVVEAAVVALEGGVAPVKEAVARARAFVTRPEHRAWFFVGALAVVGFLSVHLLAKSKNRWYFDRRHNLVCVFVFAGALVFLLSSKRFAARVTGVALLVGSIALGGYDLYTTTRDVYLTPPLPEKTRVVEWLNAERARLGRDFTVAFNQPQVVVWQTPGVRFHEVNVETSTLDDVIYMTDHLGAEVLISPIARKPKHRKPAERFAAEFVKVATARPFAIYRRKGTVVEGAADDKDDDDDKEGVDDDADAPQ